MPESPRARGNAGEERAVDYLAKKGYRILERNYRFGRNEIDIVAQQGNVLVFVEVKARRSREFGDPEDAVALLKRRRIRKVAEGYLFRNRIAGRECRFDVVAIQDEPGHEEIRHIENAF